jgi:nucleotide-binding universal stress UspA family protein
MAVTFAAENHASITGLHVMPEFHVLAYGTEMLADTEEKFVRVHRERAEAFLAAVTKVATQASVICETVATTRAHPYEAIISTATERNCDLIVMASHGRSGVRGLLIGSETQKVLTHSAIPVLVGPAVDTYRCSGRSASRHAIDCQLNGIAGRRQSAKNAIEAGH